MLPSTPDASLDFVPIDHVIGGLIDIIENFERAAGKKIRLFRPPIGHTNPTIARVVKELGLKCDFEKNGIWVEVEFGNARSYYQDYVKFMLAKKYRDARLGLLLCPTTSFASLLCELGRQRARSWAVPGFVPHGRLSRA